MGYASPTHKLVDDIFFYTIFTIIVLFVILLSGTIVRCAHIEADRKYELQKETIEKGMNPFQRELTCRH